MRAEEAIKILNNIFDQYTTVPTKRVKKLVKYIVNRNEHLKKENVRLRRKIKKLREVQK